MTIPSNQHPSRSWATLFLCAALGACGGLLTDASDEEEGPRGTVTLSVAPSTPLVFVGGSTTATLTATRTNYDLPLTLSAPDIRPDGIAVTFNPPVLSGGTRSSVLTISAAASSSLGPGMIQIKALGPDSLDAWLPLSINIGRPQVTVSRNGTGTGTVTSSPAGINCGTTCNSAFAFGTNVTLTATPATGSLFAGWAGAGCSGTAATCSLVVNSALNVAATFNSSAQSFTLGVTPATVSVTQGSTARATATITRVNGFPGPVTLAVTGAPTGLTVTPTPATVTETTATLDLTAASSLAAGNYPITITAAAAGVPSQTATFNVLVTPAPGGSANVSFSFLKCDPSEAPIWFASQSGTGAWTRVLPGPNSTFTFGLSATAGVAMVTRSGTGFGTTVVYGSRDEITSLALGDLCGGLHESRGTNQLTGTMTGIGTPFAVIAVGGASMEMPLPQPLPAPAPFTLEGAPAGRHDLIAAATIVNANGSKGIPRLILRRDVAYSSSIPQLAFNTPEAVIPPLRFVLINNRGSDQTSVEESFITTNGSTGPFLDALGGPNAVQYFGVPDSILRPPDLHVVGIFAAPPNGGPFRLAILLHHSAVNDTVVLGPALNQPSVTTLGGSPLRMRAQVASQTAYGAAAIAEFSQNANYVGVTATAGYSGGRPPNWTLEIPDLVSAGYDPAWGLRTGLPVEWEVVAVDGGLITFLGATPVDGQRVLGAGVGSTTSSASSQLQRVIRW
jgi:hypothetical protein